VLTLQEAAALLKLPVEAVRSRAEEGDLPGRRFGQEWRFARIAVVAWLADGDPKKRRRSLPTEQSRFCRLNAHLSGLVGTHRPAWVVQNFADAHLPLGPQALTSGEAARTVSDVIGRPIIYNDIDQNVWIDDQNVSRRVRAGHSSVSR
jgi:excisionase family DNA binding protein